MSCRPRLGEGGRLVERAGIEFEDAILTAVNLGDDADTTGAICGQVAGAFHGQDAIPAKWREKLTLGREIADLADRLFVALG